MSRSTIAGLIVLLLTTCLLIQKGAAQNMAARHLPSDSSLLALANKFVRTPITKTTAVDGSVFLQRNLNDYLQATVLSAPEVALSERDHGHNHNDKMLREFLNRPHPGVATLERYFLLAAQEFNVPVELLKAIGQVQSNWTQNSESIYGSWGVMGLIENPFVQQIRHAAQLLNTTELKLKEDAKTNIRGAAALLSYYQATKEKTNLEDWFASVQKFTGLQDEALAHSLAVRIFDVLRQGYKTVTLWGEIIKSEPQNVTLSKTQQESPVTEAIGVRTTAVDYPQAVANFTTCNFGSRPAGAVPRYYFVHYVATGTYQGAINWFKNCTSQVSAHYVVRNNDGEVSQVVAEASRAWSQGVSHYNDLGIGIEHEVLASNLAMWDSEPMLVSAANLCKDVCNRQAIPKVRRITNGDAGIYGHSDVRATDCPNMTSARWTNFISRLNSVSAATPVLYTIINDATGGGVTASWKANTEPTLLGYRLYYATSEALNEWKLAANETTLPAGTTSASISLAQFVVAPSAPVHHFRLTAVVADGANPPVESSASDVYSRSSNTTGPKVLIVDGFDRFGGTGSWSQSTHSFAARYFASLRTNAALQLSTAADERVADGSVVLTNYDIVVWFTGDDSGTPHFVMSAPERTALKTFLSAGGKLILSGSEIAYNVGRTASPAPTNYDLDFQSNYLKSTYTSDGSFSYTPATGMAGTAFEGLNILFGVTYPEDFPDGITPLNGSTAILSYFGQATNRGGVAYKGTFGAGTTAGGLIFITFPLETAADTAMAQFMNKALPYFGVAISATPIAYNDVATAATRQVKRINVLANDVSTGSTLNPSTVLVVTPPANGTVTTDAEGNISYLSNVGFTGTDSYQYTVQNAAGTLSNTATVSLTVVAANGCNPAQPETDDDKPKRDLRGAWISTVSNIDWPRARTLTTAQNQQALINILDSLNNAGINTIYLQVRPESDALYASTIEPWSYWLTGTQGTAPSVAWDPLAFAIEEAHRRGMELHAWINPYRAKQSTPTLHASHVAIEHPEWILDIPTSPASKILNPGIPEVRTYLTEVIADIATRYDVDGIHFDDYFYPTGIGTLDNSTYTTYPNGTANLQDWRRANVNMLIARVYDTLALINTTQNRNVVFGVSPFGIWKSGTPTGITGQSSFNDLYCDPIAWLQAGKVDYVAPQLYWKMGGPQDYNNLSRWWNDQGETYNRFIYPGLALYRMNDASNWEPAEILSQIDLNKDPSRDLVKGQILFSTRQIVANNKNIWLLLKNGKFRNKSLPPAMPWKDAVCPNAPINVRRDGDSLRWDAPAPAADGDLPRKYLVYRFASGDEAATSRQDASKLLAIVWGNNTAFSISGFTNSYFLVSSVDNNNNESDAGAGFVLPITGLTFRAQLSGNTVVADWTTLTETNTRNFEVERSTNGRNFHKIATVAAAGNSNAERSYTVQDFLQEEGIYYYRVRSIDQDGRSTISMVKSVTYRNNGNGIVLGPNPFESGVNLSNVKGVKRLDVLDLTGRTLISKPLSNQETTRLEAPGLPAGIYYLRVTLNDDSFTTIKLVKL